MRAKFGSDPTAGSKNLSFKFISRLWPTVYHSFNGIPLNGILNGIPVNGLSVSMIFGSIMANGIPLNGITLNGILNGRPISVNGLSTVFGSNMANGISFIQWYTIEWYSEWYTGQRSFNDIW